MAISTGLPQATLASDSPAALASAAQRNDVDVIRNLLQDKIDVDAAQADGMRALHWATYHDNLECVKLLLSAGADAKATNRYGVAPLSLACQNGNGAICEALLAAGADPDHALLGGETPLMTAARTGKLPAIQALLKHGAQVDAKEHNGQTAIMWAAADGHVDVVEALIDAGADFRTPLKSGFAPLFFAVREGRQDVVFRLLEAGIGIDDVMRPTRRVDKGPARGTTALHLAVENGHFELAVALLEAGADPNSQRCGYTPLHAITWVRKPLCGDGDPPPLGSGAVNSLDLVRALAAHGADINALYGEHRPGPAGLNRTGATPLLLAAETGDLPLIRLLVELGADPNITNVDHCTPLLAAAAVGVLADGDESAGTEKEAIDTIEYLLELGADINAVDDHGNTAMHGAAYASWPELVRFLASRGADLNVWNRKNQRGWTPLEIAQGHRPANFRPSVDTEAALREIMAAH